MNELQTIPFNDATEEILGIPNFRCGAIARSLRIAGHTIAEKSEVEQAYVIHFILNLYIKHGDDWKKETIKSLELHG